MSIWFTLGCHKAGLPLEREKTLLSNCPSYLTASDASFASIIKISCDRFSSARKDTAYGSIRHGCKQQRLLAQQLHRKAGVPEGLCRLPEVAKFQQVITEHQIVVFSAEHFTAIIYKGPKREKQIYLYLYQNHYDVITSVSTFLGTSYWCLECKKGYNNKEEHCCSKV